MFTTALKQFNESRRTAPERRVLAGAGILVLLMLFFYVQTIYASIDRGTALREAWRSAQAMQTAPSTPLMLQTSAATGPAAER